MKKMPMKKEAPKKDGKTKMPMGGKQKMAPKKKGSRYEDTPV